MAGPALWLSTAVVDRVGTGRGTRVAFLASWPELVGLTVLALLVALVVQAVAERVLSGRGLDRELAGLLLPVVATAFLVLPFLPFAADALPALDAFAGPGRWWVWAVVLGQVSWLVCSARMSSSDGQPVKAWLALPAVFAIGLVCFLASAWRLAPSPIYPGGDEPHYLVVTQSLLIDHDLAIANNHARGDYLAYYQAPLKPDYRVAGRDGVIYSVHPVGLSVLIAPAFALRGYRGASVFVSILAALSLALAWRWAMQISGSRSGATIGWLAVATSAPMVLHSFAIYPECPAALALILALAPAAGASGVGRAVTRGLALGALPWLGTKYAPMAAVALGLLALRAGRRDRVAMIVPFAASGVAWLGFFWWLYGTPSPTAPYGAAHQMSLGNLMAGFPGLFADQEYGVLPYAPALSLAVAGWWGLWRRDADGRWQTLVTALPLLTLALTTGAFALWWGGSAPPGRELVAALPPLAVPIAWVWQRCGARSVRRASLEWLTILGAVATATLVGVHGGLLIANGRDGASELLEFLNPARDLVRAAPSFIASRDATAMPLAVSAIWVGLAAAAWHVAARLRPKGSGHAALTASAIGATTLVLGAALSAVMAVFGGRLATSLPVEARVESDALNRYDTLARPFAIEYAPLRITSPADAMADLQFVATPGSRRAPQPIRLLLNARIALPAGTYRVSIEAAPGATLHGSLGLQVGRLGLAETTWSVDSGTSSSWSSPFTLDIDANFVGFRASADLEPAIAKLTVTPVSVIDDGDRLERPTVMGAAAYGDVTVYFHDERAAVERDGFWVRGRAATVTTIHLPEADTTAGVRLKVHGGGPVPLPVTFTTPAWSTRVIVQPDVTAEVLVPAHPTVRLLPLTIASESGFVPAEIGGAATDRRLLGCWIEVVH